MGLTLYRTTLYTVPLPPRRPPHLPQVRTGCQVVSELKRMDIELTRDDGSEDGTDTSEDGDEDVGNSLYVSEVLRCVIDIGKLGKGGDMGSRKEVREGLPDRLPRMGV